MVNLSDHNSKPSPEIEETAAKGITYPELHEESFINVAFQKACFKFMRICGVYDFGWNDIYAPMTKRFRRHLSAAINFLKFREDRMQMYEELHEQREELVAGLVEVSEENSALLSQLAQTEEEVTSKMKEGEEVLNDCDELEREIAQQNKIQASIRQESQDLKKKSNELKDQIATSDLALQEAEAEERKLLPRVVKEPQLIQNEVSQLTKSLKIEKQTCDTAEQEEKLSRLRIANVVRAENDVASAIELMKDVMEEKVKYENSIAEVEDISFKIDENRENREKNSNLCQRYEDEIQNIEDKIRINQEESKNSISYAIASFDKATKSLSQAEKGKREGNALLDTNEAEVHTLESAIKQEKIKFESEISTLMAEFKKFEHSVLKKEEIFLASLSAAS